MLDYRVLLVAVGLDAPVVAERTIAHHNRLRGRGFADVVAADEVTF